MTSSVNAKWSTGDSPCQAAAPVEVQPQSPVKPESGEIRSHESTKGMAPLYRACEVFAVFTMGVTVAPSALISRVVAGTTEFRAPVSVCVPFCRDSAHYESREYHRMCVGSPRYVRSTS